MPQFDHKAQGRHDPLVIDGGPQTDIEFERLIRLACLVGGAPIAMLVLADGQQRHCVAASGVALADTGAMLALCVTGHADAAGAPVDAITLLNHPMRDGQPLMAGATALEFFACFRFAAADGVVTGALTVADTAPRMLNADQTAGLAALAQQVAAVLDYRHHAKDNIAQLAEAMPHVVWTADADGVIDYANHAWGDIVGQLGSENPALTWIKALHPDDVPGTLERWAACIASGESLTTEYRIRYRRDGSYRWQLVQAQAIRNQAGSIVKWYGTVTDIHDRKIDQEKMRTLATRLAETLESITDALFTFDRDWRFTYVNREGEQVLQTARDTLLGKQLWEAFPLFAGTRFEAACRRAIGERCTLSVEEFYSPLAIWLEIRIYPSEGGLAVYFRDVSDRKIAEAQARHAAEIQAGIVAAQRDITSAGLGLRAVMDLMAARAQDLTGANGCVVALADGDEMVYHAGTGITRQYLGLRLRRDRSLAGAAAAAQTALACTDTEFDERVDRDVCRKMGVRSMIVAPLRADGRVIGVLQVAFDRPDAFGAREVNNLQILVESLGSVVERHRITEQLQLSEEQYRLLFDRNPHPIWIYEEGTLAILAVNAAAIRHYGYSEAEFLAMTVRDLRPQEDVARLEIAVEAMFANDRFDNLGLWRHRKKDGAVIDVEIAAHRVVFGGKVACMAQTSDVTQRVRAERELLRISRAQRMLSACNEALVRAQEETALLGEVCRIAVDIGGYRMGWVGYAQDDERQSILPVAFCGEAAGYFDGAGFSWSEDDATGRGPAGRAIRGGLAVIVDDVEADPAFEAWRAPALERGYRSVVCLPLSEQRDTFGSLNLYASEASSFGADEIHLLQSLANDLTYGIAKLRAQAEQRRMHDAILKVAAAISGASGATFFEQLACKMADALGADAAVIAHCETGPDALVRTIAAAIDGACVANFTYAAVDMPCGQLYSCEDCTVADAQALSGAVPAALAWIAPQACVGRRLLASNGQMLGIMYVLFRAPLKQADFIASALQIFAARAASELERKDADARIHEQASLLDKAQDAIVVRGIDDRILFWNKGAERLYGWTGAEVLGRSINDLISHDPEAGAKATAKVLRLGEWSGDLIQVRKDGSRFSVEGHWTLIDDADGRPQSIFEINTDITERKIAEEKILQLAFYDALTRLPNRILLLDRLQEALLASARSSHTGALLFIDLDNFKALNDTLGHDMGDTLLRQVTLRLVSCVREIDTVARLGGDEFVVLLEDLADTAEQAAIVVKGIGEKIIAALNERYQLATFEHHSTASIGITLFSDAQDSVGELLKRADLAMYQAKAAGRNTLRFFDPAMQQLVSVRVELESDLRLALQQQEFVLHYQPQVNSDGQVFGAEALIRWHHPQRGMVSPFEFISVAEDTGMILPMGHWVLATACAQLVEWAKRAETVDLVLAVNVSARQFRQPDFVDQVLALLAGSGADPTRLKLELTESLLVDNLDETIDKMSTLKECGVGFSLDDFGTGYSSLAYLKRLPLDQLKIDQSFVRDVLHDPNDAAIARTIVALARSLGLAVIAEGVETEAQRDFLAENGCPTYQGYFFSRPLPVAQFEAFLAS